MKIFSQNVKSVFLKFHKNSFTHVDNFRDILIKNALKILRNVSQISPISSNFSKFSKKFSIIFFYEFSPKVH